MTQNTSIIEAIYDLEYNFKEDIDFIKERITKKDHCLELGCGTGRVMNDLLKNGYNIDGLDISKEAIDILKSKLLPSETEGRKLIVSDMSNFKIDKSYDFIFSVFNSFMLLTEFKKQESCIRQISDHLNQGGRTLSSVSNPCLKKMNESSAFLKHQKTLKNPITNNAIEKFEYNHYDLENQTISRTFYYDELVEGTVKRYVNQFKVRYLFKYEFILMLEKAGLEVVGLYGNWDGSSLSQSSPSIIIEARKV